MPELPFRALFDGPPRYRAETPWGPIEASALTLIAAAAPTFIALPIIIFLLAGSGGLETGAQQLSLSSPLLLGAMVATQLASIGLIWLLAGRANMRPDTLQFRQPPLSLAGCLGAGLLIVAATSVLELALYYSGKFDPFGETRMLLDGLNSDYWWAMLIAAVVLAPIWEELAFRGFLLTALAKTRLGIVGGGLITNTAWTAMHMQYSAAGMASVFLAGLVLTWIMWRTSSIRACIVAHGVVNAASMAFLATYAPV